jgi:prevent-host-death family protein
MRQKWSRLLLAAGVLAAWTMAVLVDGLAQSQPTGEGLLERFRQRSIEAETKGLAEPFRGITAGGAVAPGLFAVESTGVSTAPVVDAARSFLAALTAEQRGRTVFTVDDPEWRIPKPVKIEDRVLPSAIMAKIGDWEERMKTVAATEAKNRLGAILDQAQREPIVIRRQDRDIAVVLSMADYERLRSGNIQAFLDLRNEVAAEAARRGLTEERLAELLTGDGT